MLSSLESEVNSNKDLENNCHGGKLSSSVFSLGGRLFFTAEELHVKEG